LKKTILHIIIFTFFTVTVVAQQLPYYSQHVSNSIMTNPAITGTKRLVDARLNYRMQWVGYDDAPRTETFALNSRFFKGKMGAGLYVLQDKIGQSQQSNIGASYAYHLRFPDVELSVGVAGNYTKYTLYGNRITLHTTQDPAIDQTITNSTRVWDASAGFLLYNDRFHLGFGALHLAQQKAEFYKADTTKKGIIKYFTNVHFSLGYNFAQNSDFIWESTFYTNYVQGAPILLDYTLRIHYREKFFGGVSIRLHDACAVHLGVTLFESVQVSYSYDILLSAMRHYSSGSHEIMLIFSSDLSSGKRGRGDKRFLKQRFQYLL
jgi:type IX secretion system PorP/SprF family membrane protein